MTTYKVTVDYDSWDTFFVEADSEDEAKEKVLAGEVNPSDSDSAFIGVEIEPYKQRI